MKQDFLPYKVGQIFNPIQISKEGIDLKYKLISLRFPSRLNAMAIDPAKITTNKNMVYTPGEVLFSVGIYKTVTVKITDTKNEIQITDRTKRESLVKHAVLLMKSALNTNVGFEIDVDNESELKHCGLGSSSSLIASVACAINELFGKPAPDDLLLKYVAQNHGEEIEGNQDYLNPVQCIGGSAASGIYKGGALIVAGENKVICAVPLDERLKVIIGVPKKYKHEDSVMQFDKEKLNFDKFLMTGKKYGPILAYRILHDGIPELLSNNLNPLGDIIFDYRFKMGSISNCSYVYPPMVRIGKKLEVLKNNKDVAVLSLSSVGPAFFAITDKPEECEKVFDQVGLNTIRTSIENDSYKVLKRVANS